tara:strand:+ start:1007 stop:1231 length:225 start_codon:yes stop_codon:yes gene_type:complete
LAKHNIATSAHHHGLGVGENGGNIEASRTFHIHEKAIGGLHQALELVLGGGFISSRVEEINRHICLFILLLIEL